MRLGVDIGFVFGAELAQQQALGFDREPAVHALILAGREQGGQGAAPRGGEPQRRLKRLTAGPSSAERRPLSG